VPILIQSVALGADPEEQVKAIKAITDDVKIAGDARKSWDEFLGEFKACREETPETKKEASEKLIAFYNEHFAGDEKEEEAGDAKDKPPFEKKDGDKDDKEAGDEKKDDKAAGDAIEERFTKIEKSITDLTSAVNKVITSAAGDSAPKEKETPKDVNIDLAGDSASKTKQSTSDFLKLLYGGK
jgi:hypothetical protein